MEQHPESSVLRFLESRRFGQGISGLGDALEQAASAGKCQFLLDGLDEVGGPAQRELAIGRIHQLVKKYPRCRFVLTSRIVGFSANDWQELGFSVYRLRGYGSRQLQQFADKWAKILSQTDRRSRDAIRSGIEEAVFANPRVRSLASNPLVLTILVLLNESRGGTLPRRRVDLYEKVVDVFLETWESSKQRRADLDDVTGIDLDAREFRWMLSDVALAMQKAQLTLAARWWLSDRVQEYLTSRLGFLADAAKQTADRIIRYLTERTGLLAERGPDLFGFSHRTLQEYFASLGIIDEADASHSRDVNECLREFYYHPQWSEVIRLTAAQLTPPLAESLVTCLVDDPDPVGRFLRRGIFLALNCLADGTTVANRRLIGGILGELPSLGRSRWLGTTFQAITLLDALEGTRHELLAKNAKCEIIDTARSTLEPDEFSALHEVAYFAELVELLDTQLQSAAQESAAWMFNIDIDGVCQKIIVLNAELRTANPSEWYEAACRILEEPDANKLLKLELIRELRQQVTTQPKARMRLRKLMQNSPDWNVRVACANALSTVSTGKHNVKAALLRVLATDQDERVRRSCASALRDAADLDAEVARRLIDLFRSDPSDAVRAGAARGLSVVVESDSKAFEALKAALMSEHSSEQVKTACVWSLEKMIDDDEAEGDLQAFYWKLVTATPQSISGRVAAQVLATAMAEERIRWNGERAITIQETLMNLDNPCPHALNCLEQLATARELNAGFRMESVLRNAIEALRADIAFAFVFGSTARQKQQPDSDIDLMLIGDVRLRAVSPLLSNAERQLGRRINPAIYSQDSFRSKYHAGDPFLLDVMRREKLPVSSGGNGINLKELERELGELVAERLADA